MQKITRTTELAVTSAELVRWLDAKISQVLALTLSEKTFESELTRYMPHNLRIVRTNDPYARTEARLEEVTDALISEIGMRPTSLIVLATRYLYVSEQSMRYPWFPHVPGSSIDRLGNTKADPDPIIVISYNICPTSERRIEITGNCLHAIFTEFFDCLWFDAHARWGVDAAEAAAKSDVHQSRDLVPVNDAINNEVYKGRPSDEIYEDAYEKLREDSAFFSSRTVARIPSFNQVFQYYLERYKELRGSFYKRDEASMREKFGKAMDRRRRKEITEKTD